MRVSLLLAFVLAVSPPLLADANFRIATHNLNRLFDDNDDGLQEKILSSRAFQKRIAASAKQIGDVLGLPRVLALQEIENRNVLERIALEIERRYGIRYRGVLLAGNDVSGINVGFLVHDDVEIRHVEQLFRDRQLPRDGNPLFSRPPLLLEICDDDRCLALINLHLRSMRGLADPRRRERVIDKRRRQAESLATWIDRRQRAFPGQALMLLGDFNALTPSDNWLDVAGILRGLGDNPETQIRERDLIESDLVDLTRKIPAERRYSYIFRRQKQQLDYMLVNRAFTARVENIAFTRIEYRLSDHAALYVDLQW